MHEYELVVIVNPSVADEDVPAALEKLQTFISDNGGTVAEVNQWGRKKLAYTIKKCSEGNYALIKFSFEPKAATELEASLKLSDDIIRHILIRLDA